MIKKGLLQITQLHIGYIKNHTIPNPNQTIESQEDPRLLVTTCMTIMIVVHFANVSTIYTSFGV
jgi:hypothetical protein